MFTSKLKLKKTRTTKNDNNKGADFLLNLAQDAAMSAKSGSVSMCDNTKRKYYDAHRKTAAEKKIQTQERNSDSADTDQHNPTEPLVNLLCHLCSKICLDSKDIEEHWSFAHHACEESGFITCLLCSYKFKDYHLFEDDRKCQCPSFKCSKCCRLFTSRCTFNTHYKVSHCVLHHKLQKCSMCRKQVSTINDLELHLRKIHHAEGDRNHLVCIKCSRTFANSYVFKCHTTRRHKRQQCEHCKLYFHNKCSFLQHSKLCNGECAGLSIQ